MKVWELKEFLDQCDSYEEVYVVAHDKNNVAHGYMLDDVEIDNKGVPELIIMLECELF